MPLFIYLIKVRCMTKMDHLPIYFSFSAGVLNHSSSISSPIRVHAEEGISRFTEEIEVTDWSETLGYCRTLEVSKGYQSFINVYSEAYNRCFPIAPHCTKHYRFKKPWMTPGLLKSCYKKNNLCKKFLKDPSAENKSKFIGYRNRFKRVKDETIICYYSEKFTEYSNNIRKTWDLLKLLLSRERYQLLPCIFYTFLFLCDCDDQPLASTSEIAKSFNEYFSTIGTKLAQKITTGNTFYKQDYCFSGIPFLNQCIWKTLLLKKLFKYQS